MFKSERYPTTNHVRHMLREIGCFVRYMKPLHTEKRFLMKQRAMKLRAMKCRKGIWSLTGCGAGTNEDKAIGEYLFNGH